MLKTSIKNILIGLGISLGIAIIAFIMLFLFMRTAVVPMYGTPAEHGASYKTK